MNHTAVAVTLDELRRLEARLVALRDRLEKTKSPDYSDAMPERAAVRRASLDLTKQLAKLRRTPA